MGFLITVPMLIGLVLLLDRTSSALLCAAIWAAGVFLMSLFVATDFGLRMIVMAAVAFLMALGYFALLDYLRGKGWWWVAMPVGGMILIGIA